MVSVLVMFLYDGTWCQLSFVHSFNLYLFWEYELKNCKIEKIVNHRNKVDQILVKY